MRTIIETSVLSDALAVVERAHEILAADSGRIYATINLDIRKDQEGRMEGKIRSVTDKIGSVRT